ncbi:MAG: polyphosphate kinase 2 family protein [Thermoplasmata archaeon]
MSLKKLSEELIVRPGKKVNLSKYDPRNTFGFEEKDIANKILEHNQKRLEELQYLLFASNSHSLLIILQGMDAAGKDGTIRHVMHGINPRICNVASFRLPTYEETAHDFLWRIHKVVPPRGEIGIFNRSHYEDVLAVRVHNIAPKSVWSNRYWQINDFERMLSENNTKILKFFLHVSKEEQKRRLQERIDDPSKNWKINPTDLKERQLWSEYTQAFEDAISKCNTKRAPWYIIPADKKWFRNLAISQIIIETIESLDLKFPKPVFDPKGIKVK